MPAQQTAIVDKLLTTVSNGLFQDDSAYICERLFPTLEVAQTTGKLGKYGNNHLRIESSLMGGRGAAKRVEPITRDSDSYSLNHHGLEGLVTEEDMVNVEQPFDAESDEVKGLTSLMMSFKEYTMAASLTSTSVISTNNDTLAGSEQFNNYETSDPLGVAKAAKEGIYNATGMIANTLVLPWKVYNTLQYHPQILSQLGFAANRAGLLSPEEIARAFGMQRVLVPSAVYNSVKEGQTDSLSAIWGKDMLFAHIPSSAAPYQKSLGYYVRLRGVGSRRVYKYPMNNPPNSKGILVDEYFQFLVADQKCGYLVKAAIA